MATATVLPPVSLPEVHVSAETIGGVVNPVIVVQGEVGWGVTVEAAGGSEVAAGRPGVLVRDVVPNALTSALAPVPGGSIGVRVIVARN